MKTYVTTRVIDEQRCGRLLLAWHRGDRLGIEAVLDETAAEERGGNGLLAALAQFALVTAEALAPAQVEQQLERVLLNLAAEGEE